MKNIWNHLKSMPATLAPVVGLSALLSAPATLNAQANAEPEHSSATNAANIPAATSGAPAPANQAEYVQIAPIFSQLLAFSVPKNFVQVYEDTKPVQVKGQVTTHNYTRKSVLNGETLDHWSQMITVTGGEGGARVPSTSSGRFAVYIAYLYSQTCPQTFSTIGLGTFNVGAYQAYTAVISCGTNPKLQNPQSESTLVIAIAGERDLYTIQWAFRGAPSPAKLVMDKNQWEARLQQLQPIKLCPIVQGEQPPYPSCMGSPSSQWEFIRNLKPGETVPATPPPCATPGTAQCPIEVGGKLNPEILRTFQTGLTTADQVKHALGEPAYQDHNPDGRFVFEYQTGKGAYVYAMVFSPEGKLNKIVVYGKTGSAQPNSNAAPANP